MIVYGDGRHSAVLRTLPLSGSLNRRICDFAMLRPNFARRNFTYPQNDEPK